MKPQTVSIVQASGEGVDRRYGLPVLRLGFRPFYLLAALFGCLAIPVWVLFLQGSIGLAPVVTPLLWHAHEMLFGFAAAVIVGFLLTAVRAWTGLATPRGALLAMLALLWAAARVAALTGPYAVYAMFDFALLPVVAVILADVLVRGGNRRNLPLVLILALLSLANLVFHLAVIGLVQISPLRPLYAGLALIVMIECVIGGRVVPVFTANAIPGLARRRRPGFDTASLSATGLAFTLWVFDAPRVATGIALALAAVLQVIRQAGWHPLATRRRPILWILHASYAWIALGLGLLALAQGGLVETSAGVHALAVGATGGLIVGMITRTARGHTGRPLVASRPETFAYALVIVTAVVRVFGPMLLPSLRLPALDIAAFTWSAGFALYLFVFGPWLFRSRVDGTDG